MADDWLIDVLDDLRTFARDNALPALEAQLHRARRVAAQELLAASANPPDRRPGPAPDRRAGRSH